MLEVTDLSISYGNKPAVKQVSFSVQEGQIVGLVGESGSGKSTLIRSVIGLLPGNGVITSGEILFEGRSLVRLSPKEWGRIRGKEISMIFQHPERSMDPMLTIGRQFYECGKAFGKAEKKQVLDRACALLRELHLEDAERVLDSYPFELSGGMCQRTAIAMAMLNEPRLLLADEPTSALDVTVQAQTIQLMTEVRDRYGTAILLITHDMGVVARMADMVGVICRGEMVEWGTREEVLYSPAHPYTRALMKAVPRMDGHLPEGKLVTERMPWQRLSPTHWAGTKEVQI